MDLVADMLFDRLQREHAATIAPSLIRPTLRRRAARLPSARRGRRGCEALDRVANRLWDYPRLVTGPCRRFDLFHIVDHSYAQLVHRLPAGRTLVTCHDLDTFRSVLDPALEPRSALFRAMTRHILDGLQEGRPHRVRQRRDARCAGGQGRDCPGPHDRRAERSASELHARGRAVGRHRGGAAARPRGRVRRSAARRQHDRAQADRRAAARLRFAARRAPPPAADPRRRPLHRRAAGARARARSRRGDRRPAVPRSVDARRGLSAERARS